MSNAELFRVGVFVGAVGAVYVAAGWLALRSVSRRILGRPPAGRGETWTRRVVYPLAALGLGCVAYGYFIEPYSLAVTRVRIVTPKLAAGMRPIRLVHFSDVHSDPEPRLEELLPDVIAAEKPDLIVFTGDALNSPDGLPVFRACLERIARIAPTFAVKGNWDTGAWKRIDLYAGTGVRLLDGKGEKLAVDRGELWIAGLPADREDLEEALAGAPPGSFTIFLHHYPDLVYDVARRKADLYCAGHTHGGQVALPFYGALMTLSRFGKRFEAGLYRVENTWLYVNRGIGMEGGHAPRVRFCARPELTVIEITPGPAQNGQPPARG